MPSPKQKPASQKPKTYVIVGQPSQAAVSQHAWDVLQTVGADLATQLTRDELADLEAQGVIRPVKSDASEPST